MHRRRFKTSQEVAYTLDHPGIAILDTEAEDDEEWVATVWGDTTRDQELADHLADLLETYPPESR